MEVAFFYNCHLIPTFAVFQLAGSGKDFRHSIMISSALPKANLLCTSEGFQVVSKLRESIQNNLQDAFHQIRE